MYREVDRRTAIDLSLEETTVYSIDPRDFDDNHYICLRPLEECCIQDLKCHDVRFIADMPEEDESKEDTPSPDPEDFSENSTPVFEGFHAMNLKKEGKSKPGPKTQPIDVGKIRALANAGWSQGAIASEMHLSVSTVRKYLNQTEGGSEDGTV